MTLFAWFSVTSRLGIRDEQHLATLCGSSSQARDVAEQAGGRTHPSSHSAPSFILSADEASASQQRSVETQTRNQQVWGCAQESAFPTNFQVTKEQCET